MVFLRPEISNEYVTDVKKKHTHTKPLVYWEK